MKVPRWFPQFAINVEMRPLFYCGTRIMYESYEMRTYEVVWFRLSILNWKWDFRLYLKDF